MKLDWQQIEKLFTPHWSMNRTSAKRSYTKLVLVMKLYARNSSLYYWLRRTKPRASLKFLP